MIAHCELLSAHIESVIRFVEERKVHLPISIPAANIFLDTLVESRAAIQDVLLNSMEHFNSIKQKPGRINGRW